MTLSQAERARQFAALHIVGRPLILYNAWDVGSAKAIADAGAQAIATGSWSVAASQGFADGEQLPLERVVDTASRIAAAVDVPVTIDFESGYASGGSKLAEHVSRIIGTGVVGINFEDRSIPQGEIYPLEEQARRIATVRGAADDAGVPLFINARTDLFIANDQSAHASLVEKAIDRARVYAAAGGNGFFVPMLRDEALIERICAESPLPVNVMFHPELPSRERLAAAGVARLSYGPRPYREMMAQLTAATRKALAE